MMMKKVIRVRYTYVIMKILGAFFLVFLHFCACGWLGTYSQENEEKKTREHQKNYVYTDFFFSIETKHK